MATILIGADICPIEGNQPYFVGGDAESLFHDLLDELQQADLVIANLECPLIERPSPILKTGPTFGEPGECIRGIQAGGIDVLALANNHILDHGPEGLRNTLAVCQSAGIATVGAGANLAEARHILVRSVAGLRIGIIALAEFEFSIAGRSSWGANPMDVMDFVRNVQARRQEFDYLIALVHGSAEFHVPTPRIQDTCRFLVEMGANAVIVQHPHILGGWEEHLGGHIVYGQGALVMDEAIYRDRKSFHEGVLVKLTVTPGKPASMELIPFRQSDPVPGARRMEADAARRFLDNLAAISRSLLDPDVVEARWIEFCEERRHRVLSALLGHGGILRRLNHGGWLERSFYGKRRLIGTRNVVCCETHRETVQTLMTRSIC